MELPPGAAVEEIREAFEKSGLVEYAEFDYIYTLEQQVIPNDSFSNLWGMHNTGHASGTTDADIDAPEAWHYRNNAHEVVVGIIDSGIRATHEDLAGNMWRNPGEMGLDINMNDKGTNG